MHTCHSQYRSRMLLPLSVENRRRCAGWLLFATFAVLCCGEAVNTGLSHGDDAQMALVSQSLARGNGYALSAGRGDRGEFEPGISTGPTLILPSAVVLKVAGSREPAPALTAITLWGGAIGFVWWRAQRKMTSYGFLLMIAVFVVFVVATFGYHFEQWYAFLGEVTAGALLIVAHWAAAAEDLERRRWIVMSGLCLGLAIEAKLIAAIGGVGIGLALALRPAKLRRWGFAGPLAWLGCLLAPILAFEVWKLAELGWTGYAANCRNLLAWLHSQGLPENQISAGELLRQRVAIAAEHFTFNSTLLAVAALVIALMISRLGRPWKVMAASVCISLAALAAYWCLFSSGSPRYLTIPLVLLCFLAALVAGCCRTVTERVVLLVACIT